MNIRLLKLDRDGEITVGSVVKYKIDRKQYVGEVYSILSDGDKVEVIMYDKRLRPLMRGQGGFRIRKINLSACKLVDENFKFKSYDDFTIGDVVMQKSTGVKKYGVIIGFHHPDGLSSTSYENGYNGTDMIDCVEIHKRGLERKRNLTGGLKRFVSTNKRLTLCEVDLWHKFGPKIVAK